jgi:predicted DNA repair protein MutK
MLGGAYLCFEGYEKVHSLFSRHAPDKQMGEVKTITPEQLEKERVKGAVRTDLILSAEIMAITYATVADQPLLTQIIVMVSVAVLITIAVYGVVGLLVKADDIGLHMAKEANRPLSRKIGRRIVAWMPVLLTVLSYIGTAAMLWVGAEIIAHGIPFLHHGLEAIEETLASLPLLAWLAKALVCAIGGLILGAMIEKGVAVIGRDRKA